MKVLRDNFPNSIAVRADGTTLAAGLVSMTEARIWDLATGETLHTWSIDADEENRRFDDIWIKDDASRGIAALDDGSLRV